MCSRKNISQDEPLEFTGLPEEGKRMSRSFMPQLRTPEELREVQLKGLQWTVTMPSADLPFIERNWMMPVFTRRKSDPWMISQIFRLQRPTT